MPSQDHARLLAMLRARPLATDRSIPARRTAFARLSGLFRLPADVSVARAVVAGRPAEWLEAPGAAPGRAMLYLHGGAYVVGSCATHRELAARIGREAKARVLLLEYRLAPEWPFPAALEDAVAATQELVRTHERVAIAGDSAGGGLAVAALCETRRRGLPLPACAAVLCPWTDLAATGPSLWQFQARDPLLDLELLRQTALVYLNGADPRDPRASPLFADLRGLPPLLVQVGSGDILHDDGVRLAERARSAGVEVTLDVGERMVHVWHLFAQQLVEGRQACARVGAFLVEQLARGGRGHASALAHEC